MKTPPGDQLNDYCSDDPNRMKLDADAGVDNADADGGFGADLGPGDVDRCDSMLGIFPG